MHEYIFDTPRGLMSDQVNPFNSVMWNRIRSHPHSFGGSVDPDPEV